MKYILILILLCSLALWGDVQMDGASGDVSVAGGHSLTGLVGYWSLDESDATGTAIDDKSGNGNTGTSTNTPVFSTDQATCSNQAMVFNGSSDNVTIANNSDLTFTTNDDFTISLWLKSNSHGAYAPLQKWATADGNTGYIFGLVNGDVKWYYNSFSITYDTDLLNDTWYHIALVRDGSSSSTLYIDGVLFREDTTVQVLTANNVDLVMSGVTGGFSLFNGSLSDPRIYNRALSSAEVLNEYNAGLHTAKFMLN